MLQRDSGRLCGVVLLVAALGAAGCPSEVRLEGEGGGASTSGATTSATTPTTVTSAVTGTSASSATGGAIDVEAECIAACDSECVAGPNTCLEYCLEDALKTTPRCMRELLDYNTCQYRGCIPGNDCEAVERALFECVDIRCDWTCNGTPEMCGCTTTCEEDYTRAATCRLDALGNQQCDCYENDVLVTQCTNWTPACAGHINCCRDILEN